jgi:hypothetical protein
MPLPTHRVTYAIGDLHGEVSDLTAEQRAVLEEACRRCPDLRIIQQHLTRFITIVRQRKRAALDDWLQEAEQTGLPDLVGFVQGIWRDLAAVAGALEYAFSQGVVEGQINRLKTIKRQLYGWASLRVLKQHVLLSTAEYLHTIGSLCKQYVFTRKSGEPFRLGRVRYREIVVSFPAALGW